MPTYTHAHSHLVPFIVGCFIMSNTYSILRRSLYQSYIFYHTIAKISGRKFILSAQEHDPTVMILIQFYYTKIKYNKDKTSASKCYILVLNVYSFRYTILNLKRISLNYDSLIICKQQRSLS